MGERDIPLSLDDYAALFNYQGNLYQLLGSQTLGGAEEQIGRDFEGFVQGAYKRNGVVFACMLARFALFSQARFQFQQMNQGQPGKLFGNRDLALFETPWEGATTGDWLSRMITDADLSGNHFATVRQAEIRRLRPDWVSIVVGSPTDRDVELGDLDARVLGYIYQPGGPGSGKDSVPLLANQVAHFAPVPDPSAWFRGMSWLQPIVDEVMADKATTRHKLKFFEQGATPNMVVSMDAAIKREDFEAWVRLFREQEEGLENRYKTLFLGAGMKPEVVGANFRQVDFKATQGAGETRIAAAAGVPPVIVGLSEGLQAATYSNYGQARRRFADGTMHHLWQNMAGSTQKLVRTMPPGARLWYDARHIPFLREDEKDAAEIIQTKSIAIRQLTDAGYTAQSVVAAVEAGDLTLLEHTGLFSVQLMPPGTTADANGSSNGVPSDANANAN